MKKNKNYNRKKDLNDAIFYACMVAIPTLNFFVFYLGVNLNSILLAFKTYTSETEYTWTWFHWIGDFFNRLFAENSFFPGYFKNSALSIMYTFGVNMTLSITFSIYIYHKKFAHNFFKVMLFVPSIISAVVMSTVYSKVCNLIIPEFYNTIMGIPKNRWHIDGLRGIMDNPATRFGAIIFFNIWIGFGSSILLYVGGMSSISDSVSEAAQLDGVNLLQETFHITLPLIYPTISILVVTNLIGFFTGQLNLFTFYMHQAPDEYQTIGYYIYAQVYSASGSIRELPRLSAIGLVCTFVCVPLVLTVKKLMEKYGPKFE